MNINKNKYYFIDSALKIISLISLSLALLIASNTLGVGAYEVSIYQAYPISLWQLLFLTVCLGLGMVFSEIYFNDKTYNWAFGIFIIITVNILVLSLPYLRDYAFVTQRDDLVHFSRALEIFEYKHPDPKNFYPISHLLATVFSLITGIELQESIILFPLFFYLIYLSNVIFFAWTTESRMNVRALMITLATPLIFGTYGTTFKPTHFTVYMLPFFIGWLWITRMNPPKTKDRIPFILLLILAPFLHPWATISTLSIILLFAFALIWKSPRNLGQKIGLFLNPAGILIIAWLTWFTTFRVFGQISRRILDSFILGIKEGQSFGNFVDVAKRAEIPLEKITSIILFTYGDIFLYFLPAIVVIIWVSVQMIRRNRQISVSLLALSFFFVTFSLLSIISLFRDLITQNPLRLLNIAAASVPILVSGLFYDFISDQRVTRVRKYFLILSLFMVLIGASIVGILSSYNSPLIGQPNHQYTHAQKAGVAFLVDRASNDDKTIYTPFAGPKSLHSVLSTEELSDLNNKSPTWDMQLVPAFFGYGEDYLGLKFKEPGYLSVSAYERAYYTQVWPEGGRFSPEAFEKVDRFPHWNKIYTSGDLIIWRKSVFDFDQGGD